MKMTENVRTMPKLYIKMAAADAKTMAQRVEILGFIYRAKERKEQENVKLSVPELTIRKRRKHLLPSGFIGTR